jgi:hypothetical protein
MGDKMENRHADAGSMMSGHSLSGPTWAMESHPSSIPSKYKPIFSASELVLWIRNDL